MTPELLGGCSFWLFGCAGEGSPKSLSFFLSISMATDIFFDDFGAIPVTQKTFSFSCKKARPAVDLRTSLVIISYVPASSLKYSAVTIYSCLAKLTCSMLDDDLMFVLCFPCHEINRIQPTISGVGDCTDFD